MDAEGERAQALQGGKRHLECRIRHDQQELLAAPAPENIVGSQRIAADMPDKMMLKIKKFRVRSDST